MKNLSLRTLMLLLALCCTVGASAQIRYGVKAGANFSSIPLSLKDVSTKNIAAYHVGPMLEYNLPIVPVAFDAAILFSQKGTDLSQGDKEVALRSNFIEIPVHAKLKYSVAPLVKVIAFVGPYVSFKVSDNAKDVVKEISEVRELETEKVGYGINAGIGLEVTKYLQITGHYGAALSNDYKFSSLKETAGDYFKAKNKVFYISAAVLF